ncbi:hypothetical protein QYM36_004686 [Artemia franciscana]|uniref:Uncharacterized protein n=1 Tax=Artemia franciscana TaxID=6661 RepID=A0AA88L8E2_ARTSF|nr:hypothetical protein QYM36_004686 [Artemia franciscana]
MANSLKRKNKKQCYSALFEGNKADLKRTCKVINELVSGPWRTQDPQIEIEAVALENRQESCDKIGDYFTRIGTIGRFGRSEDRRIGRYTRIRDYQAFVNEKSFLMRGAWEWKWKWNFVPVIQLN